METTKNIGIWIRVSTEFQVDSESPQHHEERARHYALSKGWNIIDVYKLEAVSGKSVMEHPETQRMLADLRNKRISGLIFSKLARVARNTKELLEFSEIFRKEGGDLISLSESIDTSTPAGRLFYTMIAAMAAWEREEIAERVAASVPVRARLGKPLGGQASFGYKWKENEYVINEKEAPVRKLIYELFLKCKRRRTVAKELNNRGYRTRGGAKFSDTTITRLLQDPSAKGQRRANYTRSTGENKQWVYKDEKDWILIPCPAIVSPEVWDECNRILDEQLQGIAKRGKPSDYLLTGYVKCSCGRKMYVFYKSAYNCKPCKNKILVSDIDEIYHEQLKSFLFSDSDFETYLLKSDEVLQEKDKLKGNVEREIAGLQKQMNEMVEMRINRELTPERFQEYYQPIELQLSQLQKQLPEIEAEIDFLKIQYMSSDTVLQNARNLYDQWQLLPPGEKRSIVETITEDIVIGKEDISINLSYLPAPLSGNGGNKQHNLMDSYWRSA